MELRDRILEATEQAVRINGLSKTTTKEIARLANCSEGSLYNHFQSKEDLCLQVLKRHLQGFIAVLLKLPGYKGLRTVQENLKEVARAAVDYFHLSIMMTASLFTEPTFLARHRQGFQERNEGPHRANEVVASYIRAEQQLGRVNAVIMPRSAADLLLGACFQHAFHMQFSGEEESQDEREKFVHDILETLLQGISA
ncbi:TetR/AcrR family transcriptional regulator [Paenibacillus humicola]|uniref:TetR/AcrR family transcriptional regulator n=1 Tax=Paenibacillus humicola TaxID=3110540 RepID=UPI00237B1041|nr:TetR/AcrR family transcriptional regulator [Paenibacillus humicola]